MTWMTDRPVIFVLLAALVFVVAWVASRFTDHGPDTRPRYKR